MHRTARALAIASVPLAAALTALTVGLYELQMRTYEVMPGVAMRPFVDPPPPPLLEQCLRAFAFFYVASSVWSMVLVLPIAFAFSRMLSSASLAWAASALVMAFPAAAALAYLQPTSFLGPNETLLIGAALGACNALLIGWLLSWGAVHLLRPESVRDGQRP